MENIDIKSELLKKKKSCLQAGLNKNSITNFHVLKGSCFWFSFLFFFFGRFYVYVTFSNGRG